MLTDASIYDDNMTLLQAYKKLEKRVKALEENGGGGGSYTLPTASETVKGGVKIGSGLQMDGEVLSATGGGGGGGGYICYTDITEIANPADNSDILLGYVTEARVELKDYTTAITYTNEDDPTDKISVYLKNSSAGYSNSDKEAYISTEEFGYIPMMKNPINDELGPVYGHFIYCYGLKNLTFYDTASQEDAEPIYSTNAKPLQQSGRISEDYNASDAYYLHDAYGWVNFSDYPIYLNDKTYKSQDSVQLSDIVGTANASGEGGDVSLYGTWLRQQEA